MIIRLQKVYERWMFNAYSCSSFQLALYRIIFTFTLIFFIGVPQFSTKIIVFPDGFFNPPPLFGLFFNDIPPIIYFKITDVILHIGFYCTFIGLLTKASGIISASICIINFGFIFSTGKIDHSFILWFTLFMMSFSGWGKEFSIDSIVFNTKNIKIQSWPISILSMGLGFAFFTAGLIKLISGWLGTSSSMFRAFFLRNYYVQQKQANLAKLFENFNFQLFWEIGDWFTVLFEIGFLVVVFQPALFRFFTLLANFFHGLVMLIMNISFHTFLPLYLLFWVPLIPNQVIMRARAIFAKLNQNKLTLIRITIIILCFYLAHIVFMNKMVILTRDILLFSGFTLSLYLLIIKPQTVFLKHEDQVKKNVIKFDGVCNLCNGFVQFVVKRDKKAYFNFSTLQDSDNVKKEYQTIILEKNAERLEKSTAVLEIARNLSGLWPYLYLLLLVPKPLRDYVYSIIAKNRYHWFGKKDTCMVPSPDLKNRFL